VNTIDFRAASFRQVGAKRGASGIRFLESTVKILDPETHQPLGIDQSGLLFVRGPNVMHGYLNRPEKTAEVLRDGCTTRAISLRSTKMVSCADRSLSRFSKIAGEMVPHIKVEDKLQGAGQRQRADVCGHRRA